MSLHEGSARSQRQKEANRRRQTLQIDQTGSSAICVAGAQAKDLVYQMSREPGASARNQFREKLSSVDQHSRCS